MVLDHVQERIEHSRGERNRCSIQSSQPPFSRVELEVAEFVEVSRGSLHRGFQNNSEKFSRRLKTFIRAPSIFAHAQARFRSSPAHKRTKTHVNNRPKTTCKDKKMKKHTRENAMNETNTLIKILVAWPFLRSSLILLSVALLCFGLLPKAQAVVPSPDGGYPGGNTAEGQNALFSLTTGNGNTATGAGALGGNTTGGDNTANGTFALLSNTEGNSNTATGFQALLSNTTGNANTAVGINALFSNTTGGSNAAYGDLALYNNTTGTANVALGNAAGFNQTTGNDNVYIGLDVPGVAGESNTIRIGDNLPQGGQSNCYIGGIFDGAIDPDSFLVGVDVNNKLGDHTTAGPRLRVKDVVENLKKVEELEATVAALTTQIQKVSAQLETSKPAANLARNNP